MQKNKAHIYVTPHKSGKTTYLQYLLKIKNIFNGKKINSLVCCQTFDKNNWCNLKSKFYLSSLGNHTLGKNVNKFFIDDIDQFGEKQLKKLKRDLETNTPNVVYATASKFDITEINNIFPKNYEICYYQCDNLFLNFSQRILNKII